MTIEHTPRNEHLWDLAQRHTAEFIQGLEIGREYGVEYKADTSKNPKRIIQAAAKIAFGSEAIRIKTDELLATHNWGANAALIEGMQEGVEYEVKKQLVGSEA